jgi:nucleotide-binding universal stress UspA family protein
MSQEQHSPQSRRIVVGVDGSDGSKAALRWADRLAPGLDAHIEAVTVWEDPVTYGAPVVLGDWRPDLDAEKVLTDTLDEVFGSERPPGLKAVVERGHTREVLLQASDGAQLLVVGSRGHGGFTGLLLGSVSQACAERARCSVLVAHDDPAGGQATA